MLSLDELRDLSRGGKQWIAAYQAREIERTRNPESQDRLQQGLRLLPRSDRFPAR